MVLPTLSLNETQAFTALRGFIEALVPGPVEVIRAEINRVPEPKNPDFIIMTQLSQDRISTNEVSTFDNQVTASIAGTGLTVSAVANGSLSPGLVLLDKTGTLLVGTVVGKQLTGSTGGVGTYAVAPTQTVASETMYAGEREDLVPIKWTVQLDFHGPLSADYARTIETLFWSEPGVNAFAASGFDVTPLYCEPAHQAPFQNNEQQFEFRWSLDAVIQLNPVVGTSQQFADQLQVTTVEADEP